jgi:hypothetical protein
MFAVFGLGFGELLFGALIVIAIIALLNRRALGNIWTGLSAQVGKAGRWAKNKDPLAVFQEEVDRGTEKIAQGRQFLGKAGGEVRSSTRAVQEAEEEVQRLNARIDTAEAAGDPNKTADGYYEQLDTAKTALTVAQSKLLRDKLRFEQFSAQVVQGQKDVEGARRKARDLGLQLEQSEREKEMNEFARSFDPHSFTVNNKLREAEDALKHQIDENRGTSDADEALSGQRAAELKDEDLARKARIEKLKQERQAEKAAAADKV